MNAKVSIVANFYNSEKYIPKLVKSVLNQTYSNWEFIAVNDCSPGNDLKLLQKFAALDEMKGKIKIVDNKENLGISKAKAEGIKAATGEYITFIDGDDWIEPYALEVMLEPAEKYDLDVVVANYYHVFYLYKKLIKSWGIDYNFVYDRSKIKKDILKGFFGINILSSVGYWSKLYKISTLKKSAYQPMDMALYEDIFFNLDFFLIADKLMFIHPPVYNWRWGGISSAAKKRKETSFERESIIKSFNDFYFWRVEILKKIEIPELIGYLNVELYNVLLANASRLCCYKPADSRAHNIKKTILDILSLSAYQEMINSLGTSYIKNRQFVDAFKRKDVDWLYSFYYGIYKNCWKTRLVRNILARLV